MCRLPRLLEVRGSVFAVVEQIVHSCDGEQDPALSRVLLAVSAFCVQEERRGGQGWCCVAWGMCTSGGKQWRENKERLV